MRRQGYCIYTHHICHLRCHSLASLSSSAGLFSTCPTHGAEGRWVPHVLYAEGPIHSSLRAAGQLRCGKHIELAVHPMVRLASQAVPEAASGRFRETWAVELASGVSAV